MKLRIALVAILMLGLVGALTAQDAKPSGGLEIYSWWSGDEGPALEALIALYSSEYPDVRVDNATVTGGAGVNFKAVLKTRMLGGDPPDTFQVHAGQELTGTWVVANRMEDLTDLYKSEGWFEAFPKGLIEQLTYKGGIYSVAVNIHRAGVMWYIPDNLKKWDIQVPTTLDEFYTTCAALKTKGVTPLVVGEAWTLIHLWETVALSVLGPDKYDAVWTGELSPTSDEMVAVWDAYGKVLDCTNINEDAVGLTWQQATDAVVSGKAAFNVMGDWAAGYMSTTLGLEPKTGFGWADFPGTKGVFMWLSDTFGLPVGAPNPVATTAWLKLLGSVEGQNAFNPKKGSIPARIDAVDADPSLYNAYSLSAAAEWKVDRLVGSLVHGVVANERFTGDFNDVIQIYLESRSSTAAASAMQAFCAQDGACGM